MGTSDYSAYDAVGLAGLIEAGDVTAIDLVEAAIDQVETLNPGLNAVIAKQYDEARRLARQADIAGPFRGVPFLTKDLALVEGDETTFGSVFFRDYRAEVTDEYQLRVRRAGLIPIGRTNSPEFGLLPTTEPTLHGATKNPWDRTKSSGGSSGGAAVAVASGMVPMAHASDGGGSIRIPASACGVFGLKPSRGLMPRFPGSAADYLSVDLGLARSVRDIATLLDVTHGSVSGSAYHAPAAGEPFANAPKRDPEPMRIAVATVDFRNNATDPECVTAVESTAAQLEDMGHEIVSAKPDVDGQVMAEAFLVVWEALAESIFRVILSAVEERRGGRIARRMMGDWRLMRLIARMDKRKAGRDSFEPFTWALADRSRNRSAGELESAKSELQRISHVFGAFMEEHDMILTPVLGSPPIALGDIEQKADWDTVIEQLFNYVAFTPIANFSGFPAMSVPTHWTSAGLPVGTHFMGRFADDFRMLSLAGQLERAMPWADRRPPAG